MTDKAAHVQAGIDPPVVTRFENQIKITLAYAADEKLPWDKKMPSVFEFQVGHLKNLGADLIAGYRSQAERIAALEVERDSWKEAALSDDATAVDLLKAAKSDLAEAREALEAAVIGLNVWTATYASDMCGEEAVRDAYSRIQNGGGTLAYICGITAKIDATLSRLKPGEKPVRPFNPTSEDQEIAGMQARLAEPTARKAETPKGENNDA